LNREGVQLKDDWNEIMKGADTSRQELTPDTEGYVTRGGFSVRDGFTWVTGTA